MSAALSWFDWRAAVAILGIIGAAALLVSWQHRTDPQRGALWLGHSALSLELLGLALSVFWAVSAPDGAILPLIFVAGWAGMLIGRAVGITAAVAAWQSTPRKTGLVALTVGALAVAYLALYGSGLFHAVNEAGGAAQARLEASRPAQALDAEIQAARQRLAGLAGYADPGKAHAEETAQAEAAQAAAARVAELQTVVDAKRAAAAQWANPDCTPKADSKSRPYTGRAATACAEIAAAQAALDRAQQSQAGGGAGGYASRHSEYNGLQAHLVELEKQRAALSASGKGAAESAWLPEDRFIAWAFGIPEETASRIKWLVFTAIFDVLSLLFRIVGAVWGGAENASRAAVHRFAALLSAGLDTAEAADIVKRSQPAKPSTPAVYSEPTDDAVSDTRQPASAGLGFVGFVQPGEYAAQRSEKPAETQSDNRNAISQSDNRNAGKVIKNGLQTLPCAHCGKTFQQRTVWQKFCSEDCRNQHNGFVPRKRR